MIDMTDQQLQDFQACLPWSTGMALPDGRVLGVAGKRGSVVQGTDFRVQAVQDHLNPIDKTILELGACEGIHTVQLSKICKHVTGVEVRPQNVMCALARLFVHGVENGKMILKDARDLDSGFGRYDILFHAGLLYHLMNPVEHLFRIRDLADTWLLDTHYAMENTPFPPQTSIVYEQKTYPAFSYKEGGWEDVFSGLEGTSHWLSKESLFSILREIGFVHIEIIADRRTKNGPRITLLAKR